MKLLELTLASPAENLALDEALLDVEEIGSGDAGEVLRLWEPREMMVVAGSSSHLPDEVNLDACARRGVPVLRRASGGATILAGPGCLMYAVVLSYQQRPELRAIDRAHQFVLNTLVTALNRALSVHNLPLPLGEGRGEGAVGRQPLTVSRAGISDLVLGDKKFSGNSLRCKRSHFLYHGTLLYSFPLEKIGELLNMPARQPAYREHRSHTDFLTNLPLDVAALRQALISAFSATEKCAVWPRAVTAQLAAEKYSRAEWNERL
ncbi:MAG TPA: lipoate--protein ligase family protein [Pirellulales bacterium]|nr:lipoate--protein ligase family protein [Pirellulales bacterium]